MTSPESETWLNFGRGRVLIRDVGEGEPVLLINGIGAHTRMWGLMERTLKGRRVISFDAPGAGRSTTTVGVTSVRRLALLAMGVLDHVGVARADAVGYSMGGIILQQLLADAPQRVRRAVLIGTTPGIGAVYGKPLSMLNVATPARFLSDRLYLRTVGSMLGGRARTDPDWVAAHVPIRLLHRPSMLGYTQQVASLATWSGLPLLGQIPHPVLVLAGDDDPLTPVANAKILAHLLPNGRVQIAGGEGHLMPMDDRSVVPPLVRDFLAAPDLATCEVWQSASMVDADDLRAALGRKRVQLQPIPWGPAAALQRHRWIKHAVSGAGD